MRAHFEKETHFENEKTHRFPTLNPIPTGLCHVITIYGLIQPIASRNRVNPPQYLCLKKRKWRQSINKSNVPNFLSGNSNKFWLNV
jgi:hypothetical protein